MFLILALALCMTAPEGPEIPEIPGQSAMHYRERLIERARVLTFATIQEEWIKQVVHPMEFSRVLPREEVSLLHRASCIHWECRESAQNEIKAKGIAAFRMLLWGSWAKDQELANFCKSRVEWFYKCKYCRGSGVCLTCAASGYKSNCTLCYGTLKCTMCDKNGDGRYEVQEIYNGLGLSTTKVLKRKLFR